jgi:uncharacterized protein (UPF0332 family)
MKFDKEDIEKYQNYKLRKSNQSLKASKLMIENNFCNEAINRLYYACFYSVTALLYKYSIEAKTHAGVRLMLHKKLVKENLINKEDASFYNNIFDYRHTIDYDDYAEIERKEAEILIKEATIFISNLNELLTQP